VLVVAPQIEQRLAPVVGADDEALVAGIAGPLVAVADREVERPAVLWVAPAVT